LNTLLFPRKGSSTSHEYQKQVVPLLSAPTADLPMKSTLNRIVDEPEGLAMSLDALELALIAREVFRMATSSQTPPFPNQL
jgi:hypothetical protein